MTFIIEKRGNYPRFLTSTKLIKVVPVQHNIMYNGLGEIKWSSYNKGQKNERRQE